MKTLKFQPKPEILKYEYRRNEKYKNALSDEELHEYFREEFFNDLENRNIVNQELHQLYDKATYEELQDFADQILAENDEFVKNDERTNFKLENLDADSEIFGHTQSVVDSQFDWQEDISPEKAMEECLEEQLLCDEMSQQYSEILANKDMAQFTTVWPLCAKLLINTDGYISWESDNCIGLMAITEDLDVEKFALKLAHAKNTHINDCHAGNEPNSWKIGVYSEPDTEIECYSLQCGSCLDISFIEV